MLIQAPKTKMNEAEARVDEATLLGMVIKGVLAKSMIQQKVMQEKTKTDLEGQSRSGEQQSHLWRSQREERQLQAQLCGATFEN